MNCPQCYTFNKTKSQKDLGDITDNNSCAYCLYWVAGPGNRISDCDCDGMFTQITNKGTSFNINSFQKVKNCLENPENKDCCNDLYKEFTNPAQPPFKGENKFTTVAEELRRYKYFGKKEIHPYGYYSPCTNKTASPGFYREGVL